MFILAKRLEFMFENKSISLDEIPRYEEVVLQNLHTNYKKIVIFNASITLLVGVLLSGLLLYFFDSEEGVLTFFYIPFVVALIVAVYSLLAFSKRKYAFREHDALYKSGLVSKATHIIPYIRIQHVVIKQGWYAKKLGLATLQLHTAANDKVDVNIPGLLLEDAKRWKSYVLNRIQELEDETNE